MSNPNNVSILHVIDSLDPGGAERVLVDLVYGLRQAGVSAGICITRQGTSLINNIIDIPVVILARKSTWDWPALRRLANYCIQHNVQLLHAHGRSSTLLSAVIKLILRNRVRLICHDHYGNIRVDTTTSASFRFTARTLVDYYIAVDPILQQWAVTTLGIAENRTVLLPNAVAVSRLINSQPVQRSAITPVSMPHLGVMVANLRPQKHHRLLFEALARSLLAREQLHILLVGDDKSDEYSRSCHRLVVELGLQPNVTFLGTRNDVPAILAAADYGLLSSRSESGPLVLLEYMAAGLPFLCTQTGQIASVLQAHGHGLHVPPDDPSVYATALDQMLALQEDQRRIIAERGRSILETTFSMQSRIQALSDIYRQLNITVQV